MGCRPVEQPAGDAADITAHPSAAVEAQPLEPGSELAVMFGSIDGESFRLGDETIRLANVDAPALAPDADCLAEAKLGRLAALELQRLRSQAQLRISREGQDDRGRTVARVSFDGGRTDAGEALVAGGFAAPRTEIPTDWCGN